MPYLKKIELRGFKSFGPKTVSISLDKGFTAITGPNGSGKTNIVDAVLFVLGELSARRLRVDSFTKLIFQGSPKAGVEKAKSAKVVIQFDNSDGRIPIDTTTVTISREVYQNGQSVYRLNGRRVPRTRVIDVLLMAGISTTGHNMILQGTITRMAEISSLERRKIIEDLIGISQYDAEKAEAEEKLRVADISIKTAMGRIDEVQKRVNDLEKERNELLRYNFLQREINRLEAIKLSHEILQMEKRIAELKSKSESISTRVDKLKQLRDILRWRRREVEGEWRKLSSEMVGEGSSQILDVQIKIGELKSKQTELATKINAGTTTLNGLKKVRENYARQLESLRKEIVENRTVIRKLKREYLTLTKEIEEKQSLHDSLAKEATQLWENLGENSKRIREIEQQIEKCYETLTNLRSEYIKRNTIMNIHSRRLNELTARRERFATTLNELQKSCTDLENVQKEQKQQLKNLQQNLDRKIIQKEAVEREISEAGKIADSAREAVVEFATQKELAETVAAEEKALRNIEELSAIGVIPGIYGRLKNLVKIDKGYEKAIEAAADGWLDALVVKDFDTAYTCTETLRQLKLGRIKIIAVQELSTLKPLNLSKRGEKGTLATNFIKCSKEHEPAITYVFGDTFVTDDEKSAFEISREGFRAVTPQGDLYEAGCAFEGGYYRAPIDFSAIIPSESAIKSLDEAVRALQQHLAKREKDITSFEEEIDKTRIEIARLSDAIITLDREITRIYRNIKRTKRNIRRIDGYIQNIQAKLENEKTQIGLLRAQRQTAHREIQKLRQEARILRRKTNPAEIQAMEVKREKIAEEIIQLRQKRGAIDTEISTLQSKFENVLRTSYQNAKIQFNKIEQQFSTVAKEVEEALQQRETLKDELLRLEKQRKELSQAVVSAKKESRKFTSQIDDIDKKLQKLDTEYEETTHILNQLQLNLQTSLFQVERSRNRLKELGYETPIIVSQKQLEEAEASLRMMQLELDRLGAINQLALSHYTEQISRYKELSLRLNELEKEKQAIVNFMEEIEQKKHRAFSEAFEKINTNLKKYFPKLTNGGKAELKLENPENPFQGGIDMIVQFPDKPPILVSGASGGECSVAAVAFIFALQEFTPATFYLLDEIDAHLDALHVSKLSELLLEESEKAQFIVITLKPEMVSKAQRVYGVYGVNGISNVVSMPIGEAK
jgi:chromosome segregation protein